MQYQDPISWVRIAILAMTGLLLYAHRRSLLPAVPQPNEDRKREATTPVFVWGDWEWTDDEKIVLHFRVERALIWWLMLDDTSAQITEAAIMPKNCFPGQEGRIEMRCNGILAANENEPIEFGIRYCTTSGTIKTQRFTWLIWREPAPVAREWVLVA